MSLTDIVVRHSERVSLTDFYSLFEYNTLYTSYLANKSLYCFVEINHDAGPVVAADEFCWRISIWDENMNRLSDDIFFGVKPLDPSSLVVFQINASKWARFVVSVDYVHRPSGTLLSNVVYPIEVCMVEICPLNKSNRKLDSSKESNNGNDNNDNNSSVANTASEQSAKDNSSRSLFKRKLKKVVNVVKAVSTGPSDTITFVDFEISKSRLFLNPRYNRKDKSDKFNIFSTNEIRELSIIPDDRKLLSKLSGPSRSFPKLSFRVGSLVTSIPPSSWKLNRKFVIGPTLSPKLRNTLYHDLFISHSRTEEDLNSSILSTVFNDSHIFPDSNDQKNIPFVVSFERESFKFGLFGDKKVYCTVHDLQLIPELLECHSMDKILVNCRPIDPKTRKLNYSRYGSAFLGGIENTRGKWENNCALESSSITDSNMLVNEYALGVYLLCPPVVSTDTRSFVPVSLCSGVLNSRCFVPMEEKEDYDNISRSLFKSTSNENNFQSNIEGKLVPLSSGRYKILLYVSTVLYDHSENIYNYEDRDNSDLRLAGQIIVDLVCLSEKENTLTGYLMSKVTRSIGTTPPVEELLLEELLSSSPISKETMSKFYSLQKACVVGQGNQQWDERLLMKYNSLESIAILSACSSRLLAKYQRDFYLQQYSVPAVFLQALPHRSREIHQKSIEHLQRFYPPFEFSDQELMNKSISMHEFWGHCGEEDREDVLDVVKSVLLHLSQPQFLDIFSLTFICEKLYNSGSIPLLWIYFEDWLASDKANFLVEIAVEILLPSQKLKKNTSSEFIEKNALSEEEWAEVRCAVWCLVILGLLDVHYQSLHDFGTESLREKMDLYSPQEVTIPFLAKDLACTLLSYAMNMLTKLFNRLSDIFEEMKENIGVVKKESEIFAKFVFRDHFYDVCLDFSHEVLSNVLSLVSLLSFIAQPLSMDVANLFLQLFVLYCDLVAQLLEEFDKYSISNGCCKIDLKKSTMIAVIFAEKEFLRKQIIFRNFTLFIATFNSLLRNQKTGLRDIVEFAPTSWQKRSLHVNSAYEEPTEPSMSSLIASFLTRVGEFMKDNHREFVVVPNIVDYDLDHESDYAVIRLTEHYLKDEVEMLFQQVGYTTKIFSMHFDRVLGRYDLSLVDKNGKNPNLKRIGPPSTPRRKRSSNLSTTLDSEGMKPHDQAIVNQGLEGEGAIIFTGERIDLLNALLVFVEGFMSINFAKLRILQDLMFNKASNYVPTCCSNQENFMKLDFSIRERSIYQILVGSKPSREQSNYMSKESEDMIGYVNEEPLLVQSKKHVNSRKDKLKAYLGIFNWASLLDLWNMKNRVLNAVLKGREKQHDIFVKIFSILVEIEGEFSWYLMENCLFFSKCISFFWSMMNMIITIADPDSFRGKFLGDDRVDVEILNLFQVDSALLCSFVGVFFSKSLLDPDLHPDDVSSFLDKWKTSRQELFDEEESSLFSESKSNHFLFNALKCDQYIGITLNEKIYGKFHVGREGPIGHWLKNRSLLFMNLSSFIKSSSMMQLLNMECYVQDSCFIANGLYDWNGKLRDSMINTISSLRDLSDCDPLHGDRPDVCLLSLINNDDVKAIIRTMFDVACYLPKHPRGEIIIEKASPIVVDSKKILDSSGSAIEDIARNGRTPFGIRRGLSHHDILTLIKNFYVTVEDCRRDMMTGVINIMQILSPSIASSPLALEPCLMELLDRAVLCSLPSASIVHNCQSLAALFGDQYRFKGHILSPFAQKVYQRGSGASLQSIYGILDEKIALSSPGLVSLRERIYMKYAAVKFYVMSKVTTSLRYFALSYGFHNIFEFIRHRNKLGNQTDKNYGLFEKKLWNMFAMRFDNLVSAAAIQTLMKTVSRNEIGHTRVILGHILQELADMTKIRVNSASKGDIRLYIAEDLETRSVVSNNKQVFNDYYESESVSSSSTQDREVVDRAVYLDIRYYFLGTLNEVQQCIGYEYYQLPRHYRVAYGVLTDPMEEMGSYTAPQTLVRLLLNEMLHFTISKDFHLGMISSLLEKGDKADNVTAYKLEGKNYRQEDFFDSNEDKVIRMLEHQHQLARRTVIEMMEIGDWETSELLINNLLTDLNRKLALMKNDMELEKLRLMDGAPSRLLMMSKSFTSLASRDKFTLYRTETLVKELKTLRDTVNERLTHDGESRSFPLYYALRLLKSPWDDKQVCDFLELHDFLAATSLQFHGIGMMGKSSTLGKHEDQDEEEPAFSEDDNGSIFSEESIGDGLTLSMKALGQGTWILLRYDPSSFISSAKMYKRFAEGERRSREKGEFTCDMDRMGVPMPPPCYHSVLNKLFESFPQFRVVDCNTHSENIFNEGSTLPILQLFEAYPVEVCNDAEAMESLNSFEKKFLNEQSKRAAEQDSENSLSEEASADLSCDDDVEEVSAEKHYWERAFRSQNFYIFAFEDESGHHFSRNVLSEEEMLFRYVDGQDASDEIADDLTAPRIIRYHLSLSLRPEESSSMDDKTSSNEYDHSIAAEVLSALDSTKNSTLPWIGSAALGLLCSAKRISVVDAMIQVTHYQSVLVAQCISAVQKILSLSSSELANQPVDDVISPDTIFVSTISILANMVVCPNACCVGIHNVLSQVSAALEHMELMRQKIRKEKKKEFVREMSGENSPQKLDDFRLELHDEKYDEIRFKLDCLMHRGRLIQTRIDEICHGLREFLEKHLASSNGRLRTSSSASMDSKRVRSFDKKLVAQLTQKSPSVSKLNGAKEANEDEMDDRYETLIMWKMLILWIESNISSFEIGFAL